MLMLCPLYDTFIGIEADQYWPELGEYFEVGKGDEKIKISTVSVKKLSSHPELEG